MASCPPPPSARGGGPRGAGRHAHGGAPSAPLPQVGHEGHVAGADLVIPTIHDLPRALPGLFAPREAPAVEAVEQAVAITVPA